MTQDFQPHGNLYSERKCAHSLHTQQKARTLAEDNYLKITSPAIDAYIQVKGL